MNVLSLFDGMSCGQQALKKVGIKVDNYFASEIDKYAIQVTMANFPNTQQLGSVIDVNGYTLPKIDLLIGGSPCQSFSFAGKRKGMSTKDEQEILTLDHYLHLKSERYEFEGQSYLFWEYMRLLNEVKPKYFLLENVMMGEKWEKILSKAIGVKPIEINSSLVSAQNRRRLYWTNIGMEQTGLFGDMESIIKQPKDKAILLKDILESEVNEKYYISDAMINRINRSNNAEKCFTTNDKSLCLAAGYYKQGRDNQYIVYGNTNAVEIVAMRGRGEKGNIEQKLEFNGIEKSNSLTTVQKDNLLSNNNKIRRLTPIECERLQTVADNYTNHVSDSQRYKMLGNGWTIDIIAHIFSYIK
jgi:DNA (cytosine-5)-methyltransferase 3A